MISYSTSSLNFSEQFVLLFNANEKKARNLVAKKFKKNHIKKKDNFLLNGIKSLYHQKVDC